MNHNQIELILDNSNLNFTEKLQAICDLLQTINEFDWVGVYYMNDTTRKLHLGPFSGEPTDHVIIPYGKGICGQVAESGTTYLTNDVNSESNYIACSIAVKSEIVLPIFHDNQLVAQLDIDSHTANAFTGEHRSQLEIACELIGQKIGEDIYENRPS